MNVTIYLFGEFNNGYTQYPDDYAESIFHKFHAYAKATTQISIHREGNLMYYGYVRKLEQGRYIGFCVVINGLMLTKLDGLFWLYENIISNLIINGQLIHFNEEGNIVTNVDKLYMNNEEINLLTESFRSGFYHFESSAQLLPAVSYGVSKDSVKNFSAEDNLDEIIKSSHTYGYTYVYKSIGFNTAQFNSYKGVLTRLNKEKTDITKRYDSLTKEYEKTLKQKKQYRFVVILFLIVLGCGVGLSFLSGNLNTANKTINVQSDSLKSKNNEIENLNRQNYTIEKKYQEELSLREGAENSLASIENMIGERQPFVIKNTLFNFRTGYLSFSYYGFRNESVKIQVRAHSEDGYSYNNTADIDVYLGDNDGNVYLSQDLDSQKWYSFEILRDNVIIGGDRH